VFVRDTLSGDLKGAVREMVVINTAVGLLVADFVSNLKDGVDLAIDTIDSGKAAGTLSRWAELSHKE